MRLLALFVIPLSLYAQVPQERIPIPAGTTRQVILQIGTPPVAEDAFYFDISSKQIAVVLILPDGSRVTKDTARSAGFDWGDLDITPRIGSTDAGAFGSMHFMQPGQAGKYVVEFTAPAGVPNAFARAQFGTEKDKYSASMSQAPGFQRLGPLQLAPGQNALEIVLDRDEEGAIFDLLTPTGEPLTLTLPDGQTIDSSVGQKGKISWITATREKVDPPNSMFGMSGFLLRDAGTHHVVFFENAAKGKYQIRAVTNPVTVSSAFIPCRAYSQKPPKRSRPPLNCLRGKRGYNRTHFRTKPRLGITYEP